MEVDYELTRGDYEHLNLRAAWERQGKLLLLFFFVFGCFLFASAYHRNGFAVALITAFVGLTLYALMIWGMLRLVVGATFKAIKQSPAWGKTAVRLEPDSVTSETYLVKSEIRWEAITKVAEDKRGFYLHLNPVQIIMVPRRVFTTADEAQKFWQLTQEYLQHARPAAVAAERVRIGR